MSRPPLKRFENSNHLDESKPSQGFSVEEKTSFLGRVYFGRSEQTHRNFLFFFARNRPDFRPRGCPRAFATSDPKPSRDSKDGEHECSSFLPLNLSRREIGEVAPAFNPALSPITFALHMVARAGDHCAKLRAISRNIPASPATYERVMRLPLKNFRFATVLILTASFCVISITSWFLYQRADFEVLKLRLGREGTLASVGQVEFRNSGIAKLTLEEGESIEFSFDRSVFERALFRFRRLRSVAPPGPGLDAPGFSVIVEDGEERLECFIGHSRNLTIPGILALAAGLGEVPNTPDANTEDLTVTFASESLASVSVADRLRLSNFVKEAGALTAYYRWIKTPMSDTGIALTDLDRKAIRRPAIWRPVPWQELVRISSSDEALDAVVVVRTGPPFGDGTGCQVNQTNLYVVPKGSSIADEPPILAKDLTQYLENLKATTLYAGFGVENISLSWANNQVLLVSSDEPNIEINKVSEKTIPLQNRAARRIRIFYRPLESTPSPTAEPQYTPQPAAPTDP